MNARTEIYEGKARVLVEYGEHTLVLSIRQARQWVSTLAAALAQAEAHGTHVAQCRCLDGKHS